MLVGPVHLTSLPLIAAPQLLHFSGTRGISNVVVPGVLSETLMDLLFFFFFESLGPHPIFIPHLMSVVLGGFRHMTHADQYI